MAINFEAANMAGYNNPRIEVFKATLAADGTSLAQYPEKAAIIAAINRGTIPFILLNTVDGQYLLTLHDVASVEDNVAIDFTAGNSAVGEYTIGYPPEPNGVPQYAATP